MKSALDFLVAAKRCEIHGLEQLMLTSELVRDVTALVHLLQRERGASNVYLASGGRRFVETLAERVTASRHAEQAVRAALGRFELDSGRLASGARLFTRIACVLDALDGLQALRYEIRARRLGTGPATKRFSRLIAGLLAVVFEAADTAVDPEVSRALVALFHFMQGKELAGQERALGAAALAGASVDEASRQALQHLQEAQARCFQIFAEYADPLLLTLWRNLEAAPDALRLIGLREQLFASGTVAAQLSSEDWFDVASARIDAMHQVEDCATDALLQLSQRKLAAAQADLSDHQRIRDELMRRTTHDDPTLLMLRGSDGLGAPLRGSVMELLQLQAQRLQRMSDELAAARVALHERKTIERAKGLLMSGRGLSEEEAYRLLRQTAMSQNRRLVEVAEAALALADVLRAG